MLHIYQFYAEVAVLEFSDGDDFVLTYDTPITNDVEIVNNEEELQELLKKIKGLK